MQPEPELGVARRESALPVSVDTTWLGESRHRQNKKHPHGQILKDTAIDVQ